MARWTEDRERGQGGQDRWGEDERRWRGEEGWRGRDWREDERGGSDWRGEDRGEWQGGAREWEARERDRDRFMRGGGEGRGRYGERGAFGLGYRWHRLTGKGPKGYKRPDDRIMEDVCERIARSWVDAEDVEVEVKSGEVTLTGFVASREEKRMLEDLADDVFGVDEVHNHLRMRREAQQAGAQTFTATGQAQVQGTQPPSTQGATAQRPVQPQQPGARH